MTKSFPPCPAEGGMIELEGAADAERAVDEAKAALENSPCT